MRFSIFYVLYVTYIKRRELYFFFSYQRNKYNICQVQFLFLTHEDFKLFHLLQ